VIRAFALGLALGAVLAWWWPRIGRRGWHQVWTRETQLGRIDLFPPDDVAPADPYLRDLAAILEQERW